MIHENVDIMKNITSICLERGGTIEVQGIASIYRCLKVDLTFHALLFRIKDDNFQSLPMTAYPDGRKAWRNHDLGITSFPYKETLIWKMLNK